MSAPMVPAPITCTRCGFQLNFLGAWPFRSSDSQNTRRRLVDCSDTMSGANARVSAAFSASSLPP